MRFYSSWKCKHFARITKLCKHCNNNSSLFSNYNQHALRSTDDLESFLKSLNVDDEDASNNMSTYFLLFDLQNDEENETSVAITAMSVTDFAEIIEELHQQSEELNASIINSIKNVTKWMSSSSRSWDADLSADTSEEILYRCFLNDVDSFIMTLELWMKKISITRQNWESLREVLILMKNINQVRNLLKTLSTFWKHIKAQLSLLKMQRKKLTLKMNQMSTLVSSIREDSMIEKNFMYYFNSSHLFEMMLSAKAFTDKLHLDMINFVDKSSKLWKSYAWEFSIRSCSEQFAQLNKESLFSLNVIYFKCSDNNCKCDNAAHLSYMKRIIYVEKDHISNACVSEVILLTIQRLAQRWKILKDMQQLIDINDSVQDQQELFALKDIVDELYEEQILKRITDVHFDYYYENSAETENLTDTDSDSSDHVWLVHCIINTRKKIIWSINQSSSSREKLEIKVYEREYFVQNFVDEKCLSISFLCFVDNFDLFRNMYWSLMKIYAILTDMTVRERTKRINVFSIILDSHDAKFLDVVNALQFLTDLNKRMNMTVQRNSINVCVFVLAFTENMSQQNKNSECKISAVIRDCWSCVVEAFKRSNLKYDIITQEWYHEIMKRQRAHLKSLRSVACIKYYCKWELNEDSSALLKLTSAFNIILTRSADSAHSNHEDLAKCVHELLFMIILIKQAQRKYVSILQHF